MGTPVRREGGTTRDPGLFRPVLTFLYIVGLGSVAYFLASGAAYYLTPIEEHA